MATNSNRGDFFDSTLGSSVLVFILSEPFSPLACFSHTWLPVTIIVSPIFFLSVAFFIGVALLEATASAKHFLSTPAPVNLTLEYLPSPVLGVDKFNPRFGWKISLTRRGGAQTSYQVRQSSTRKISCR
jgi:hypothetical protein